MKFGIIMGARGWVHSLPQVVFSLAAFWMVGVLDLDAATGPLKLSAPFLEGIQLRLEWSGAAGPFQLEQAPTLNGPWQSVGEPVSETTMRVTVGQSRQFFRVIGVGSTNSNFGEEAMRATLAAVGTFVDSLPRTDRKAWLTQLLSFLNQRSDIDSAGGSEDGVWAISVDGFPLAIWNNRQVDPPGEGDPVAAVQLAGTEIPGGGAARFAATLGKGFRLAGPRLSRLLAGNGYATAADAAPLHSLKGQQNQSIFFFNTHAGQFMFPLLGADGELKRGDDGRISYTETYGLWSGTKLDPRSADPEYNHSEFVADLRAKRLALAYAPAAYAEDVSTNQVPVNEWRFVITAQWVRSYMSFPPENHASVWLAACSSATDAAAALRTAFRGVGAEMVSGWTSGVDGEAIVTSTTFLFDRLLGANSVLPSTPPLPPLDYEASWEELRTRGLHSYPVLDQNNIATTTQIVYEGALGDDTFGLFAPSLADVLIDDVGDRVQLTGLFGNPPKGDRQVTIGGVDATVITWEPRRIVCALARTGPGSAGEVLVMVRGHRSNVRQIIR